jgi:hypothetical protein
MVVLPKETVKLPPTPLTLIEAAIEKGMDPDQLGKLMDLQERYERNRAVEAFNVAMNACQNEMPTVLRDAENTHTQSKYSRLETVMRTIKPVYTKHGFSLCFGTQDSPREGYMRVTADVRHVGGHCESHHLDVPLDGAGAKGGKISMNAVQACGSTTTYAQRYLAKMIFNITIADEDNDGMGAFVSPEQIEEINRLIEEVKDSGKPFDFARFLAWLNVESLDKVPQSKVSKALMELGRKRRMPVKGGA